MLLILAALLASGTYMLGSFPAAASPSGEATAFVLEHCVNLGLPFRTNYSLEKFEVIDSTLKGRGIGEGVAVTNVREGNLEGNLYETYSRFG